MLAKGHPCMLSRPYCRPRTLMDFGGNCEVLAQRTVVLDDTADFPILTALALCLIAHFHEFLTKGLEGGNLVVDRYQLLLDQLAEVPAGSLANFAHAQQLPNLLEA